MRGSFEFSDHAVRRWRQRAARHATEGAVEILAALAQARRIPRGEPVPGSPCRVQGMCYAVWRDLLFVMRPLGPSRYVVLTVQPVYS